MSVKNLKILVVLLALALLAACFKIYSLNQPSVAPQSSAPYVNSSGNNNTNNTQLSSDAQDNIALAKLPPEARQVLKKIQNREDFPYRQDGQTFGNREGLLPKQARGYYQEYTVPTPNIDHRGARRIVSGQGKTGDAASSGEYYYTADHYRSFSRIRME